MTKNSEISAIFYEMSEILEMQGVAWKPRAYLQAAMALEALKQPVEEIYEKGGLSSLEQIPNIGEALAKKIEEYLKTGKINEHQKLLGTIPKHILELMRIPGLGAKKISKLNKILGITNVNQLEKAAKSHRIASIPGFGKKSESDILEAIALSKKSIDRIPLENARKQANSLVSQLKNKKVVQKIEVAGSIRREKPTVKDIDILAISKTPEKAIDAFANLPEVEKVLAKGSTKAMVILKSGTQADLRVLKPESWAAGLLYFIGNKNFNIAMRKIAIKKGCKLSEYGLFDKKTNKAIPAKSEKDIFKILGMKYKSPKEREM
jgi:DNA polymerase (family 10)